MTHILQKAFFKGTLDGTGRLSDGKKLAEESDIMQFQGNMPEERREHMDQETRQQVQKKARIIGKAIVAFCKKWGGFCKKEYDDARIMTNAATITLFLCISIFPLLMVLFTLLPLFPITFDDMLQLMQSVLPGNFYPLAQTIVEEIYPKSVNGSVLSLTIVLTLWSASSGVSWLVRGVNDAYRSRARRNWVSLRLISLLYTLILILVLLVSMVCFVFGHNLQDWLIREVPSLADWKKQIMWIRTLSALGVVAVFVSGVYQVFPANRTFFLHQLPGALFATAAWYIFSNVYARYLQSVSSYSYMYGSLATLVSAIIWLFICMNIILIGGEINYLWNQRRLRKKELKRRQKEGIVEPDIREICDEMKRIR